MVLSLEILLKTFNFYFTTLSLFSTIHYLVVVKSDALSGNITREVLSSSCLFNVNFNNGNEEKEKKRERKM
jgi:hypothetical protein